MAKEGFERWFRWCHFFPGFQLCTILVWLILAHAHSTPIMSPVDSHVFPMFFPCFSHEIMAFRTMKSTLFSRSWSPGQTQSGSPTALRCPRRCGSGVREPLGTMGNSPLGVQTLGDMLDLLSFAYFAYDLFLFLWVLGNWKVAGHGWIGKIFSSLRLKHVGVGISEAFHTSCPASKINKCVSPKSWPFSIQWDWNRQHFLTQRCLNRLHTGPTSVDLAISGDLKRIIKTWGCFIEISRDELLIRETITTTKTIKTKIRHCRRIKMSFESEKTIKTQIQHFRSKSEGNTSNQQCGYESKFVKPRKIRKEFSMTWTAPESWLDLWWCPELFCSFKNGVQNTWVCLKMLYSPKWQVS